MTTTTLRLSPSLKQRINKLAKSSGTSAHNLMLEAITQNADELQLQSAFHAEADARLNELLKNGAGMDLSEMRTYLSERASEKKRRRPRCVHGENNSRSASSNRYPPNF